MADSSPSDAALLRSLVDHLSAMVAYWDASLRCRFANRAYERWFGVSPDALIGTHIRELLGPLYELNLPYIQSALRGERQTFERRIPDPKGGPPRDSLAEYVPDVVDGVVRGFFVLVSDISAVKRAEAMFSGIVEMSADAIISIDRDQRIRLYNDGARDIFGWTADEVIGQPLDVLIPPRFRDVHRAHVRAFAEGDRRTRRMYDHRPPLFGLRKSGEEFPAEASISRLGTGVDLRMTVSMRDISDRVRLESERRVLAALVENSSDFIGVADPAGTPIYVNPAGRRMVGLTPDHPIETTRIPDYYPPDQRAFAADVIVRSMLEHDRWSGETWFRNWQTGAAIPVSDEHFMIRDPDGRVLGMGTVTRDISEAKRIAREREDLLARERAARAQAETATAQLAELEERFRLAIDDAPIGMAIVALDGRFVRVNRVLCEIVGYTADELTGLTFQAITHPDDLATDLDLADQLARGEIPRYQLGKRYVRKDGSIVEINLSGSVLRGADGAPRYFIAQVEDITERKRLERQLQRSEARASGIVSISADAIISIDDDQRIVAFNAGAEKIFGYGAAEMIGQPLELLLPERFRTVHRVHVTQFASGPQAARRMGEHGTPIFGRRKGGSEFPADAAISKLEVGGERLLTVALRDITEQKLVEHEQQFLAEAGLVLAGSLELDETLARVAELAVREFSDLCIIDLIEPSATVRRVRVASRDPARSWLCRAMMELPLDRSRPHLLYEGVTTGRALLLGKVSATEIAALSQSTAHLELLTAAEVRSLIVVPLIARDALLGAIAFSSSIPGRYGPRELRFAEQIASRSALSIENARLYEGARRATQARDDVLAVVAHDLRNPLNSILLQAEVMSTADARSSPRSERAAAAITRAARRMNHLIQDLLDVASLEAGHLAMTPTVVEPAQLIVQLHDAQQQLATTAGLELRLDTPAKLPDLEVDPDRLLQVFENLVGNAIKFTPAGGQITVGARPYPGEVRFWVRDTGPGIPAVDLPHLFDRYWQARKRARHGAGLGLPIAKGIVEAHQGRMWVDSEPGRGTTFFFTIPVPSATARTAHTAGS